ncbi:MAG: hypothetical protein Q9225_001176 [Loekoesia sp. 1 TL-2023]
MSSTARTRPRQNLVAILLVAVSILVFWSQKESLYLFHENVPSRSTHQDVGVKRAGVPFGLDSYSHNLTAVNSGPHPLKPRSHLTKRAVDYHSYVCKGGRALDMIIQDPPSTRTWTQQDLNNNGWMIFNEVKEVSADLVPALQGLGVPHAPENIHPVFAEQERPFTDRNGHPNTHPTKGFYYNKYIPDSRKGAIVAEANFSPRFKAGPTAEIPPLNRWSDIVWFLWSREAGNQAKDLRYVFRDKVNNEETRGIIDKIHRREDRPDTLDLPWPGDTYDMRTDDGKALLGSPHGIGLAYLIRDHSNVLGRKIPFAHVFTVSNAPPPLSGSEGDDSNGDDDGADEEGSQGSESSSEPESSSSGSSGPRVYDWNYYIVWELRDSARGDMPTQ